MPSESGRLKRNKPQTAQGWKKIVRKTQGCKTSSRSQPNIKRTWREMSRTQSDAERKAAADSSTLTRRNCEDLAVSTVRRSNKIEIIIIINFENNNKFKIFRLCSLDTHRAEIRYHFWYSRTAPEMHLELARRTVRLRIFISDARAFWKIDNFLKKNVNYYQFKYWTWEAVYISLSRLRLSCAFSIFVIRTFLHAALIDKKQRTRKQIFDTKTNFQCRFPVAKTDPFSGHWKN